MREGNAKSSGLKKTAAREKVKRMMEDKYILSDDQYAVHVLALPEGDCVFKCPRRLSEFDRQIVTELLAMVQRKIEHDISMREATAELRQTLEANIGKIMSRKEE